MSARLVVAIVIGGAALAAAGPARRPALDVTTRDITLGPDEVVRTTLLGIGKPVVLIPGLVGGAYSWRTIMAPLAERGYQAIIIDPLGTGFSGYPKHADYSLTAQADRIGRALDTLGVTHAMLVAQSVGASIAFRLAYRRPELVRSVVSLDGGPVEEAATPGLRSAMRFAGLIKLFMGSGTLRKKVRHGMLENSADSTWITDSVVYGYTAGPARNVHQAIDAMHGMARAKEPELLRDHLGGIRGPVRLLVGSMRHGSGIGDTEIAELKQGLRDFAVDSIFGAGQFIQEERPEAVLAAIDSVDRSRP
ncbi:MAG TPA: alpha/beta fold hydrolase [Gemmatimonadales bacterium]|nr:alpha/beta fold hydrolase [Gemmatimonadales bacterium]